MGFRDDGLKPKLTEEDKKQALALRKHYRHHLPQGYTVQQINKMTPREILNLRYGMTYTEYMDLATSWWYPDWFNEDPVDDDGPGPFDDDPGEPADKDEDIPF